jgi:hypothetical protein
LPRCASSRAEIELLYPLSPAGIFIQVSYGLPFFRDRIRGKLTDEYYARASADQPVSAHQ